MQLLNWTVPTLTDSHKNTFHYNASSSFFLNFKARNALIMLYFILFFSCLDIKGFKWFHAPISGFLCGWIELIDFSLSILFLFHWFFFDIFKMSFHLFMYLFFVNQSTDSLELISLIRQGISCLFINIQYLINKITGVF